MHVYILYILICNVYICLLPLPLGVCCADYASYGEKIPRYQADLEKRAVLGVCQPQERQHVKWRATLQRRKERDEKLRRRTEGKALGRVIAASVQACDRWVQHAIAKRVGAAHGGGAALPCPVLPQGRVTEAWP
jgi:hypothetical protein